MGKGPHAEFKRVRLDDQLYILLYEDGRVKVCLQEGTLTVTEVMTRNGQSTPGSHVFLSTRRNTHPKPERTRDQMAADRRVQVARGEITLADDTVTERPL